MICRYVTAMFVAIACVSFSGARAARPNETASTGRPNILWISTEDISPDLGCYGDAYAITPNIDALAAEGAIFTRAFSHAGVCAPTRSGIITGMYPTSIGTHHMRSKGVPPAYVKCFTEYLRAAGYWCTNASKTDYNFDCPLTAWDELGGKAHWRSRPDKDQPFFCVINLTSTHESRIRVPDEQFFKATASLSEAERHDPAQAPIPPYYPDTPIVRRDWARYSDNITAMDKRVAAILANLKNDGLADNTIVFFWGDHGRGLPRAKRWIYDSGIQVPLIVRWPGKIKPGTVRDDLVCFLDLAPTLLSLAGIEPPKHMQGQVILGEKTAPPREYIFAARDRMDETYDIIRCARDKQYKYIRNFQPEKTYAQRIAYMDQMPTMKEWRRLAAEGKLKGPQKIFFSKTKPVEELYDITKDPHEIHNLADSPEHQEVLTRMRGVLEKWMKDTGDLGLVPEPELNERARPGGKWATTADPEISLADGQVKMACATDGASIAYRHLATSGNKPGRWQLYTGPFATPTDATVEAKACRLGYKDSRPVRRKN